MIVCGVGSVHFCYHADKESFPRLPPLTDERLYGGDLAQVLKQLMDGVIVLWSYGVLMVQQQLTGQKYSMLVALQETKNK